MSTQPLLDNLSARILIVDDHAAVRAGLKNLISSRSGWLVCGEASDGDEAIEKAVDLKPSAIVMDVSMPRMNGLEATRRIRERLPGVEVLIVSQHDSDSVVLEAQRAGARGFVVKSHLSADLLPALEAALHHSSRISAPVANAWQNASSKSPRPFRINLDDPGPHDDLDLMSGGGEMGRLIRAHDWSRTAFGPVSEWPQSLRTALRICLDSRFPIVIWWGRELRLLYNDAWKPALGTTKHPQALGAPGREVWADVWDTIGPMLEGVMRTGRATWENDQVLLFDRHGYVEESYWTYSYSAIRLSSGEIGGVFSAVHEVTDRVLSARRLKTLREVADQVVQAKNEVGACTLAMQSVVRNPADCPFAMIFLIDGAKATRVAASFDAGKVIPSQLDFSHDDSWSIKAAAQTRSAQLFAIENAAFLPAAPFGSKCRQAMSIPIMGPGLDVIAVLTVGLNPYRALDDSYREFLESLSQNLAANLVNATRSRVRREGAQLERRLRAEAEQERAQLSQIIDAMPVAVYTTDAEGRLTHFNPAAVKFAGRVPQVGSDSWCVTWKIFRADGTFLPHDQCPMAIALREGRIIEGGEYIAERPDGTRVWFAPYPRAIRDASGKIVGGVNMLVDITERKKNEQATGLLAGIVASSDDAIVSKNLDGVITSWNKSAERIFGYTAEEAIGQHITLIIPPDRKDEETGILERLRRGQRVEHFHTVRVRKDGRQIDVSLTISPVKDSSGRVVGASKVARDITDQIRADQALRASEERLRSILETTPECVKLVGPEGKLLHMNSAGLHLLGTHTPQALIGKSFYDVVAPEFRQNFRAFNQRVCSGEKGSLEFDVIGLQGIRRHLETHAAPFRNPDGTLVHLAVTRDITERKEAEERERLITAEVVAATAKFRAVFEQTPVFAGIMNKEGILVEANKLSLQACGYRAEEVLGVPFWETRWWRNFPESREKIRAAIPLAAAGVPYREILHYSWSDGTERLVDFALYPIVDDAGQVLFLHPNGVDITDLKQAEANSRNLAERLEVEVRARTKELELRNADVVEQSRRLRDLSWKLLRTQDEERRYVARELHDSAGQTLALLGMSLAQHTAEAKKQSPALAQSAEEIEKLVKQLQTEIRTTSYLLHPPLLDEAGLVSALRWYIDGLRARSALDVTLSIAEPFDRLPGELELAIFRLVQECLANILRHSGSNTALIQIRREHDSVFLQVRDQGKGMPPEKLAQIQTAGSGVGLRGMRERVLQFGGSLEITSTSSGTTVSAILHVPETSKSHPEGDKLRVAI